MTAPSSTAVTAPAAPAAPDKPSANLDEEDDDDLQMMLPVSTATATTNGHNSTYDDEDANYADHSNTTREADNLTPPPPPITHSDDDDDDPLPHPPVTNPPISPHRYTDTNPQYPHRTTKWNAMLAAWDDTRPHVLRRRLRKGIPTPQRAAVWLRLASVGAQLQNHPGAYQRFLQEPLTPKAEVIERDIHRTFPGHPWLAGEEGQAALRRVLLAYAVYDPTTGYCQGMNFIAGLLLTVLGEGREEEAFWMLVCTWLVSCVYVV